MQRFKGSNELTLEEVERRWTRWRRGRNRGRVPNELWRQAVDVAAVYGVESTATRLNVEVDRLREQLRQQHGVSGRSAPPAFVELSSIPAIPVNPGREWTVELEEVSGRKLRVACKGLSTAQVIEVAQSLWRVPS
jgi:hypothetical protein